MSTSNSLWSFMKLSSLGFQIWHRKFTENLKNAAKQRHLLGDLHLDILSLYMYQGPKEWSPMIFFKFPSLLIDSIRIWNSFILGRRMYYTFILFVKIIEIVFHNNIFWVTRFFDNINCHLIFQFLFFEGENGQFF